MLRSNDWIFILKVIDLKKKQSKLHHLHEMSFSMNYKWYHWFDLKISCQRHKDYCVCMLWKFFFLLEVRVVLIILIWCVCWCVVVVLRLLLLRRTCCCDYDIILLFLLWGVCVIVLFIWSGCVVVRFLFIRCVCVLLQFFVFTGCVDLHLSKCFKVRESLWYVTVRISASIVNRFQFSYFKMLYLRNFDTFWQRRVFFPYCILTMRPTNFE